MSDCTLGQLVEAIQTQKKSDETQPVNILLSDQLKELKVGNVKLTEVYPQEALEAVAQLTSGAFMIDSVSGGKIVVVRPATSQVEVKAIRISWMEDPTFSPDVSMLRGFLGEQNPEAVAEREKQIAMQLDQFEMRIGRKTDALLKSIDEIFEVHAGVSHQSLPLPKIMIQRNLGMIMLVGHPESVKIASEIIEATNSGPARNRSGMPQPALFGGARSVGMPGPAAGRTPEPDPAPSNPVLENGDPNKP